MRSTRQLHRAALAGALVLASVAMSSCGDGSGTSEATAVTAPTVSTAPTTSIAPTVATATTATTTPTVSTVATTQGSIDPALQPVVASAVADLAQRLGVDATTIVTVSAESVEWPNGALGCPKPGLQYTQVVTPGASIALQSGGTVYRYHSGGSRAPFLCDQPVGGSAPVST